MASSVHTALTNHDLASLADLLAKGADPNIDDASTGYFPLHAAVYELDFGGHLAALQLLIQAGADIDRKELTTVGSTPLLVALLDGQTEAAKMLLAAGANTNLTNGFGESPLRICVEQGDLEMVNRLLEHGAAKTINEAGGHSGRNALGHAVANLDLAMVKTLLEHGADPRALDIDYQIARKHLPERTPENDATWQQIEVLLQVDRAS